VVNPRQVRDFAKATGQLAKTDALDAHAVAHFAEAVRPVPRPLLDAQTEELCVLLARRRQLIAMRTPSRTASSMRRVVCGATSRPYRLAQSARGSPG
jgi:transposase